MASLLPYLWTRGDGDGAHTNSNDGHPTWKVFDGYPNGQHMQMNDVPKFVFLSDRILQSVNNTDSVSLANKGVWWPADFTKNGSIRLNRRNFGDPALDASGNVIQLTTKVGTNNNRLVSLKGGPIGGAPAAARKKSATGSALGFANRRSLVPPGDPVITNLPRASAPIPRPSQVDMFTTSTSQNLFNPSTVTSNASVTSESGFASSSGLGTPLITQEISKTKKDNNELRSLLSKYRTENNQLVDELASSLLREHDLSQHVSTLVQHNQDTLSNLEIMTNHLNAINEQLDNYKVNLDNIILEVQNSVNEGSAVVGQVRDATAHSLDNLPEKTQQKVRDKLKEKDGKRSVSSSAFEPGDDSMSDGESLSDMTD